MLNQVLVLYKLWKNIYLNLYKYLGAHSPTSPVPFSPPPDSSANATTSTTALSSGTTTPKMSLTETSPFPIMAYWKASRRRTMLLFSGTSPSICLKPTKNSHLPLSFRARYLTSSFWTVSCDKRRQKSDNGAAVCDLVPAISQNQALQQLADVPARKETLWRQLECGYSLSQKMVFRGCSPRPLHFRLMIILISRADFARTSLFTSIYPDILLLECLWVRSGH